MILTPLQLVLIITLVLIVCGTVTWLITMHQRDAFDDRINYLNDKLDALQYRIHRIEHPNSDQIKNGAITINPNGIHFSEDALAAWEHIINTQRKRSNRT